MRRRRPSTRRSTPPSLTTAPGTDAPVVVGLDPRRPDSRAVVWAAREAARLGRPLHIVQALELHPQAAWPAPEGRDLRLAIDVQRSDAWRHLTEAGRVARRAADVVVRTSVRLTSAQRALQDAAEDAHLVVLGGGGSELGGQGLDRALALHGATTPCAIVVVDEDSRLGEHGGEVLALADGSASGRAVLTTAADLAEARCGRLTIVPMGADLRGTEGHGVADTLAAMEDDLFGATPSPPLAAMVAQEQVLRSGSGSWTLVAPAEAHGHLAGRWGRPEVVVVDARYAGDALPLTAPALAPITVILPAQRRTEESLEQVLQRLEAAQHRSSGSGDRATARP